MKKKLLCAVCALLSVVCLTTGALAAETYTDIAALYEHWSVTKWPSWVCSVSSTDGSGSRLTVVVESQEAAEKLVGMVADDSTLTVVVSADGYTDSQLQKVQEEIVNKYMTAGGPVVSVGVGWASIDGVVTGFGESGKESRVVVGVLEEYVEEYRELLKKQYGDMVYVEVGGFVTLTAGGEAGNAGYFREELGLEAPSPHVWYLLGLGALLCAAVALDLHRHHTAAVRTSNGHTITAPEPLTARQVEAAVAGGAEAPDDRTYQRILEKLERPDNS